MASSKKKDAKAGKPEKKEKPAPAKAVKAKAPKKEKAGATQAPAPDLSPAAKAVDAPARKKGPSPEAAAQAEKVKGEIEGKLVEIEALINTAFTGDKTRSPRWALKRLDDFRKDVARHLDRAATVQ